MSRKKTYKLKVDASLKVDNPLSYQWKKDGEIIPGANTTSYTTSAAGHYSVLIKTDFDENSYQVDSRIAEVSSFQLPVITSHPAPLTQTINFPASATLTAAASGTGSLFYRWSLDGQDIIGANGPTITIFKEGIYQLFVKDDIGSVYSNTATLSVNYPPSIIGQPTPTTIGYGTSGTFSVDATGTQPLSYQWYINNTAIDGATNTVVKVLTAGSYKVKITNLFGSVTSVPTTLTYVNIPPSFVVQPQTQLFQTSSFTGYLTSLATGSSPISYQWYRNGSSITNATSSRYITSTAGTYYVKVTSPYGTLSSTVVQVRQGNPPAFLSQPIGGNIVYPNVVTITPSVSSDSTLVYKWYQNNSLLSNTTSSISVSANNFGTYNLVLSNIFGSVTSSNIAVTQAPYITAQPISLSATSVQTVTFSVSATGNTPFSYQWLKNDVGISGATFFSYSTANSPGKYRAVVSSIYGSVTSDPATLTITSVAPTFVFQPVGSTIINPATYQFTPTVIGDGTLSYQWIRNGVGISGATNVNYTTGLSGSYVLEATSIYGKTSSAPAVLNVNYVGPTITVPPSTVDVVYPNTTTLSVGVTGSDTLTYQWKRAGNDISGANSPTYTTGIDGSYTVLVQNPYGQTTSPTTHVNVKYTPGIISQPSSSTVTFPASATFSVAASGTAPYNYQWYLNGSVVSGATSSSFTTGLPGSYYVKVNNGYGEANSNTAVLTVNYPPSIAVQPSTTTIVYGNTANISVNATGSGTLTYLWYRNGVAMSSLPAGISGATSATLSINTANTNRTAGVADLAGKYKVVITSIYGSITSNEVDLIVNVPPYITSQPSSVTVAPGTNGSLSVTAYGTAPVSYLWYAGLPNNPSAVPLYTETSSTLTKSTAQSYYVVISNPYGSVTSSPASISNYTPPVIYTNPTGGTATDPGYITLSVSAGGATSYVWYKDGLSIPNSNSSVYYAYQPGSYYVICTNAYGSTNSGIATVNIIYRAPYTVGGINGLPAKGFINLGETADLSINAGGSGTLSYTWYLDGTIITTPTYPVVGSQATIRVSTAGVYTVVVSSTYGSVTSDPLNLIVKYPPVKSTGPVTAIIPSSFPIPVSLSATFTGTTPMVTQWYKDNVLISGTSSTTNNGTTVYTLNPPFTISQSGSYKAAATNDAAANVFSDSGTVYVNQPPIITTQPSNVSVLAGVTSVTLTAAASASGLGADLSVNWYHESDAVNPVGTSQTISVNRVGNYYMVATNYISGVTTTATSNNATVSVGSAMTFTSVPSAVYAKSGQNADMVVSINSTAAGTYTYVLEKLSSGVWTAVMTSPVTTSNIYTFSRSEAATYRVKVYNGWDYTSSNPLISTSWNLVQEYAPSITTQPVGKYWPSGTVGFPSHTLSVSINANTTNPSYQWQYITLGNVDLYGVSNDAYWINITNATGASYTTPAVRASQGYYRCLVSANYYNGTKDTVKSSSAPVDIYPVALMDGAYSINAATPGSNFDTGVRATSASDLRIIFRAPYDAGGDSNVSLYAEVYRTGQATPVYQGSVAGGWTLSSANSTWTYSKTIKAMASCTTSDSGKYYVRAYSAYANGKGLGLYTDSNPISFDYRNVTSVTMAPGYYYGIDLYNYLRGNVIDYRPNLTTVPYTTSCAIRIDQINPTTYQTTFGDYYGSLQLTLTIPTNTYICGPLRGNYTVAGAAANSDNLSYGNSSVAFEVTNTTLWGPYPKITINHNGYMYGAGGNGGEGSSDGYAGGSAFRISTPITLNLGGSSYILAGGGGGAANYGKDADANGANWGSAGGGGAGIPAGKGGTSYNNAGLPVVSADGTSSAGGAAATMPSPMNSSTYKGGNGGAPGVAGGNVTLTGHLAYGGVAGYSVIGTDNILNTFTWPSRYAGARTTIADFVFKITT